MILPMTKYSISAKLCTHKYPLYTNISITIINSFITRFCRALLCHGNHLKARRLLHPILVSRASAGITSAVLTQREREGSGGGCGGGCGGRRESGREGEGEAGIG